MDLKQRKLSKSEWDSIEIPVSKNEISVLKLITDSFTNVSLKVNHSDSIFTFLKIECNPQIEEFLYVKFFASKVKSLVEKYNIDFISFGQNPNAKKKSNSNSNIYYLNDNFIVKLKSSDQIRLSRLNTDNIDNETNKLYEFVLFENLLQMVENKTNKNNKWMKYYYTLVKLMENNVEKLNRIVKEIVQTFLTNYENDIDLLYIVKNSSDFIEKNSNLLKFSDMSLYEHQKQIYSAVKIQRPKLILYIAPTGTGKTLTPLGLSEKHKIIFVCAARHVGLALARSAISIGKRIAFAFGCSCAEDVRLHYFSAKEYTKDKRSGQIRKVDNSVGDKVEIIICDIRSYLPAMYYMASFNDINNIVTYWDEPTIAMDCETHDLHQIIHKNWKMNIIPNVVLSSATLPKMHELTQTIADFKNKFPDAVITNIVSHDCRKTITLVDNNGYIVMPHYLHENYNDILETVAHCEENLTLIRYFDLNEASQFIHYIQTNNYAKSVANFERNIASIDDINMQNIKMYYLKVLKNIVETNWSIVYNYFKLNRTKRITINNTVDTKGNAIVRSTSCQNEPNRARNGEPISRIQSVQIPSTTNNQDENNGTAGAYITTKDAYTLTDGPTIFIANDLQKIAKFCIQQSNIPSIVMKDITEKIEFNNQINERIDQIEKELEFEEIKLTARLEGSTADTSKEAKKLQGKSKAKIANKILDKTEDRKIAKMKEDILTLRSMIKNATIDDLFIPNRLTHLDKWAKGLSKTNPFTSDIDEETILNIMSLKDVDDSWKILLLLGIGVFTQHKSSDYTEIMKKLTDQQKLYLIIADSDYIWGTNYQFCHGYLSKDLTLTLEKIIQALGRIGRNNIQQDYTIRFRDNSQISTLFTRITSEDKPEVINMNILFNCKKMRWNGSSYEELPDDEDNDEEQEQDEEQDGDEN